MKALISKIEIRESGYRVAQVEQDKNIFDVAEDFYWIDCPKDIKADEFWYDYENNEFKKFPEQSSITNKDQPTVFGAQTL